MIASMVPMNASGISSRIFSHRLFKDESVAHFEDERIVSTSCASRDFISPAALRVNVKRQIRDNNKAGSSNIIFKTSATRVFVFPEPAVALMKRKESVSKA